MAARTMPRNAAVECFAEDTRMLSQPGAPGPKYGAVFLEKMKKWSGVGLVRLCQVFDR